MSDDIILDFVILVFAIAGVFYTFRGKEIVSMYQTGWFLLLVFIICSLVYTALLFLLSILISMVEGSNMFDIVYYGILLAFSISAYITFNMAYNKGYFKPNNKNIIKERYNE